MRNLYEPLGPSGFDRSPQIVSAGVTVCMLFHISAQAIAPYILASKSLQHGDDSLTLLICDGVKRLEAPVQQLLRFVGAGVLAVGAYLVIQQQASAGIIIAGSILSARALAPVDLAIAHWRGFVGARQSWDRLNKLLAAMPALAAPMPLSE